jgi:hypothetical protein
MIFWAPGHLGDAFKTLDYSRFVVEGLGNNHEYAATVCHFHSSM